MGGRQAVPSRREKPPGVALLGGDRFSPGTGLQLPSFAVALHRQQLIRHREF